MFATFPEFSKLTLADRDKYDALIRDFPPLADISFRTLMTWCNPLDSLRVSLLNNNLVISYWLPGDDASTGLSLVGTNKVDESLCTLFDHLREKGDPIRLVDVPQLVIDNVRYPELFTFKEDRGSSEYILEVSKFYPIGNITGYRRGKVKRQLDEIKRLQVKSLDLGTEDGQRQLLDAADMCWEKNINNFGRVEKEALTECVMNSHIFRIDNVCLFVGDKLQGFCLYETSRDSKYAIVGHVKAVHDSLLGYELIAHLFAKWFVERGVGYVNINSDSGLMRLRMFMLTLGPVNFFRKYYVEPA